MNNLKEEKILLSMLTHPYFIITNIVLSMTPIQLRYIFVIDCALYYILSNMYPALFSVIER